MDSENLRRLPPEEYKLKMQPDAPKWELKISHGFHEWHFKTPMKENYLIRDTRRKFLLFITEPNGAYKTSGEFLTLEPAKEEAEKHYFRQVAQLFKSFKLTVWVPKEK